MEHPGHTRGARADLVWQMENRIINITRHLWLLAYISKMGGD